MEGKYLVRHNLILYSAVAVEFSAELKNKFPSKSVTILHSGSKLLSKCTPDKFAASLLAKLTSLGVTVHLNTKVKMDTVPKTVGNPHIVETESGENYQSDITVNSIGRQIPNTLFMPSDLLDEKKLVKVSSFLNTQSRPDIFSLGDCAETGAPRRYVPIGDQAPVVATNILASIEKTPLKEYKYKAFDAYFLALGPKVGMVFIIFPYHLFTF